MGRIASNGDRSLRRRGWINLTSLLAVELVALVGSRLVLSLPHGGAGAAVAEPAPRAAACVGVTSSPALRVGPIAEDPRASATAVSDRRPDDEVPASGEEIPRPGEPASGALVAIAGPEPDRRPDPVDSPPPLSIEAPPPALGVVSKRDNPGPRRVRVRDESGLVRVARVYRDQDPPVVLLPDGQLGVPSGLSYTDEPFAADRPEVIAERLTHGPFPGFSVYHSAHYVVVSEGSPRFAEATGNLLESLYTGLSKKLREKELNVHDAEFPLVAVIFRDEEAFRAHSEMPPDVTAYYHVLSNRIYLYETSESLQAAPDVAARRRPQTIAHEGTHQVLQNIGLHPRLASWPPWIVEGLAEYFAPTTTTRDGDWGGANKVNPFHMATIRDLQDPLAIELRGRGLAPPRIGRDPRTPLLEYLVTREELNPTDYALSWAVTHFLANKRFDDFLAYLRALSGRLPLLKATPEQHLDDFRGFFGRDLMRLERSLRKHLGSLKNFENLPYYAVTYEQPVGRGVIRRGAMVTQSAAMIRQWVDELGVAASGPVAWRARPFPTRTRARLVAEQWLDGH
jgi:hypothetical protein